MPVPITLAEAKAHLRVLADDEDELITSYIAAAALQIEKECGVVCGQRADQVFTFDRFEPLMLIPRRPVIAASVAVAWLDADGAAQDVSGVRVLDWHDWTRIAPAVGSSWPCPAEVPGAVTVTATVGYPEVPVGDDPICPPDVKEAAKVYVEHRFRNRGIVAELPLAFASLLEGYLMRRV